MTRCDAMELAEAFQIIQRHAVARKVEPAVEEHAAVAGGEDKAVAVQPARLGGVERHGSPEQRGANVGGSERKAEVAGFAFGDGIHGQSAGIAGGEFERGGIEIHRCKAARKTPSRHEGKRQGVPTAPKSAGDRGGLFFVIQKIGAGVVFTS